MSSSDTGEHSTKTAFLIDCDGGLGTAFHNRKKKTINVDLIKSFPQNNDFFLFFNSNDPNIVKRHEDLKTNDSRFHIFPTIIKNARNGADMNLAFTLGVISEQYDHYIIVARSDRCYDELKERLEYKYPRLKDRVDLQRFEKPEEFAQYMHALEETTLPVTQTKSMKVHHHRYNESLVVTFTSDNLFNPCPLESCRQSLCLYRCKGLLCHLSNKHRNVHCNYCPTCEEITEKDDPTEYKLLLEHVRKEHVENNVGFRLSIRQICREL